MASPQIAFNLAVSFFKRNNPVEVIVLNAIQSMYNVVTLMSRLKLLKYRRMLELQKLERIETTLNSFNPYEHVGNKMNRMY